MGLDSFQKTILFIAIFILLIFLLFIGLSLSYSTKNATWPPVSSSCPDYWGIDGSGNCINNRKLGTCNKPLLPGQQYFTINFNQAPYTGSMGDCAKYGWANNCNVAWDGVNYGVSNPCQESTNSTTLVGSIDSCIANTFKSAGI